MGIIEVLNWEDASQRTIPESAPPGWIRQYCCQKSAQTVDYHKKAGRYSARFQLDRTDPNRNGSKRAELARRERDPQDGERWYGFSIRLSSSTWDLDPKSAEIVTQWHHAGNQGSPPLALITNAGYWQISRHWKAGPDGEERIKLHKYVVGKWTNWVFYVRWGATSSGALRVWCDGDEVLTRLGRPNKYNDGQGNYMKIGVYKWDWASNPDR